MPLRGNSQEGGEPSQDGNQQPQPPQPSNLLADIRQTLFNVQAHEQEVTSLNDSVNTLLAYLNEHFGAGAAKSQFSGRFLEVYVIL